jgi:hypothetical protein
MQGQLSVGDTIGEVFAIYRARAGVLLPVAFWLFLVVGVVDGLVGPSVSLFPVLVAATTVAATIYKGMVVGLVRDARRGRQDEPTARDLIESATPVLLPLIVAGVLSGLGIVAGLFLLVVPGLFLLTIWAVIAPVIVVEGSDVLAAFARSRELVRGFGWPVFGALIVALLIEAVGSLIFFRVATAIADGPLVRIVFGALAATITAPITALLAGVLYYRLLDLKGPAPAAERPPV